MENNDESILKNLTNSLENVITGIPAPIRKNFIKALGQLCTSAIDIPIAWLEGKSEEIRATTEARVKIISKEGQTISENLEIPKEYIQKASSKFAAKVIKEQINLDDITLNAAKEILRNNLEYENLLDVKEISDDWLNEFENLAKLKSSEDMKLVFGKILSGEIINPGSFSIRTIKIISQLDNEAAILFQKICSSSISLKIGNNIVDVRMVSFKGSPASNSLSEFGLSFDSLNILQEYGLIISDYNSYGTYSHSIAVKPYKPIFNINFQEKEYYLSPINEEKYETNLKLNGVALTKAGKELFSIIPVEINNNYKQSLIDFFKSKNLELILI